MNPVRVFLSAALFGLTAAVHGQSPVSQDAAASSKTPLAFVTNNPSDYWTICRKGTEAAAKDLGTVTVKFVEPDDGTAATQKHDMDDLLKQG